jgi:hypothetical protein
MPTRVHLRVLAFLALGGCGGIDIDLPELETGDVDGGLDIGGDLAGELDDGWSSDPDDGDDDGGNDDGNDDVDDGDDGVDDGREVGSDVDDGDDDDGSDDGPIFGDCCDAHDSPGCDDHEVSACVCELDSFCCEILWDQICVDEVNGLACGVCEGQDDGSTDGMGDDDVGEDDVGEEVGTDGDDDGDESGGNTGPCCEPHDTPGCEYAVVAACVCEADPFCCDGWWDDLCVAEVDMLDCGVCGSLDGGTEGGTTDDGSTDDGSNDDSTDDGASTGACCEPHDNPGCEYPEVEDCVCLVDSFCCEILWDAICVDEVETLVCGVCS